VINHFIKPAQKSIFKEKYYIEITSSEAMFFMNHLKITSVPQPFFIDF